MTTVTIKKEKIAGDISSQFRMIYLFGIVLSLIISFSDKVSQNIFLILSIAHVLILSFWGYKYEYSRKASASRVQTAGYLYTLIGFASALLSLNQEALEAGAFSQVLIPLGAALSTSIIGWLLGGELSSLEPDPEQVSEEYLRKSQILSEAFDLLDQSLKTFLTNLSTSQEEIIFNISELNNKLEDINSSLSVSIANTKSTSNNLSEVAKESRKTSKEMQEFLEAVKQVKVLVATLDKLFDSRFDIK